jgi:hypothetical protein
MKILKHAFVFGLVCLCMACSGASQPAPTPLTAPSASPSATPDQAATAIPPSQAEPAPSRVPSCANVQVLDQPITFVWPHIEKHIQELEGSEWSYFACAQPPQEVSAFYRQQMPKPPYNMQEANWVEIPEGTLGVYFHNGYQSWFYVWVVPQPDNPQASYVIVAVTNDSSFQGGECRLDNPAPLLEHVWSRASPDLHGLPD